MGLLFSTSSDPTAFLQKVRDSRRVRTEDVELVAEEQKTRILERTARGVDYEERAFAPYSTKGPYYYYPNGRLGKLGGERQAKRNYVAARRFHAKINAGRGVAIGEVTPGGAVKFASYAEFKQALGRTTVDLMGPRAPLMLQSIVKTISGPLEVKLGIYDPEKAAIASGHQTGVPARHLPQRKFFAISPADKEAIKARLVELMNQRT